MVALVALVLACDWNERQDAHSRPASESLEGGHASKTAKAPSEGQADPPEKGPLLPDAPWFELPADWADQHPTLSPNARVEVHARALAERQLGRSVADAAGRVRLESVARVGGADTPGEDRIWRRGESPSARPVLTASSAGLRFVLVFEVGEPGVRAGGTLSVLADPFWFWSTAQVDDPDAPGFTTARLLEPIADPSVRLVPDPGAGSFRVDGNGLAAGSQVEIVYGAGAAGAQVDRYAEEGAEIRIGLDADADGRRVWLREAARVDVVAGAPAALVAFGPAEVEPGAPFALSLALVDSVGNRAAWPGEASPSPNDATSSATGIRATVAIEALSTTSARPTRGLGEQAITAEPAGPVRIALGAPKQAGTLRLRVRLRVRDGGARPELSADVPPIVVREGPLRLVWADLHGHTRYSDGTGTPDAYFRYARDVARLDVLALTDHDHWGIDPLDEDPDRQAEILELVRTYHAPGRFVTLPGYEWTSWLHGHRHVLAFADGISIHSAIDPATDRPDELWAALRGRPVLTFAHHSAGDPIATNWHFLPDPELEPVTEIASVHGMSEAADAPAPIAGALPGHFVRDVLLHGARLGFIGSGDTHDGHPGLGEHAAGQSGLAGLFVSSLDRDAIHAALRARRTFATNGIRPWFEVSIDGVAMGGILSTPTSGEGSTGEDAVTADEHVLRIRYEATAPVERVELIRTGRVAAIVLGGEAPHSLDLVRRIPKLRPGEFHYVRVTQVDGGVAWSSPIFAGEKIPSGSGAPTPEPR